jgi:hypothetical protein
MLVVGFLGFGLAVDHADARRLGGGKSFGTQSRSVEPPANQTAVNRNAQTPPAWAGCWEACWRVGFLRPCSSEGPLTNCA